MASVLLVVAALLAQTPTAAPADKPSVDYVILPIVTYSSDTGLGLGAAGELFFYGDQKGEKRTYSHLLQAQVMFTTGGVQSHFITYDGPHLLGPVRLEAHLEFNKDLYAPFYGPGNKSFYGTQPDPGQKFDSYKTVFPVAWLRFRARPFGEDNPFEPYLEYRYQSTEVDPYADSVLLATNPLGIGGGKTGQIIVGLLHDTRDSETVTTTGGVEEVATGISLPEIVSDFTFVEVTASERRFFSLWTRRLVLAFRLVFDTQIGHVPFFQWSRIGGIEDTEGIGGVNTVRGIARDRYVGNVKAFGNAELRFLPITVQAFGRDLDIGGVIYWDVGRVWHPGVDDGPIGLWHPGAGGGLRFISGDAVVRLDFAKDLQLHRYGFYFAFGESF